MKKWKAINIIVPVILTILWYIFAPIPIKIPIENNKSFWFMIALVPIFAWDIAIVALLLLDWLTDIVDWRWWGNTK